MEGIWFKSPGRGPNHDIVIYYIHGGGFVYTSVYVYLEFMVKLMYSLHFQGFRNPAIFMLNYTHIPETGFANQLSQVTLGWNYLKTTFPDSHIALFGDSNGATLGMGLLLHIASPAYHVTPAIPAKPDAAVFVSPICSYIGNVAMGHRYPSNLPDYMEPWMYKRYGELMISTTKAPTVAADAGGSGGLIPEGMLDIYMNPGLCRSREWWAKAMPEFGIFLMYGDEEYLRPEIEELYMLLTRAGECRIAGARGQLHNWPIFQLFIGARVEDREQGVEDVAVSLAHMILWRNLSVLEREDKFEQYLIRKLARSV